MQKVKVCCKYQCGILCYSLHSIELAVDDAIYYLLYLTFDIVILFYFNSFFLTF